MPYFVSHPRLCTGDKRMEKIQLPAEGQKTGDRISAQWVCAQVRDAIRVPRGGGLGPLGEVKEGFMEEVILRWSQKGADGKGRRAPYARDITKG